MKKYIRDDKVAVLYSPGYGAGWSTWASSESRQFLLFDPTLVQLVLEGALGEVTALIEATHPEVYTGGVNNLKVAWLDSGTQFRVEEYDGSESIVVNYAEYWDVA